MIKLINQLNDGADLDACLAMILNERPIKVFGEFHKKHWSAGLSAEEYLESKGVPLEEVPPFRSKVLDKKVDAVYLACAPDLHIRYEFQYFLLIVDNGTVTVLDPNNGRSGKCYYTADTNYDRSPLARQLTNFNLELKFNIEGFKQCASLQQERLMSL